MFLYVSLGAHQFLHVSAGKIPRSGIVGRQTVVQSGHVRFLVALHLCQHLRERFFFFFLHFSHSGAYVQVAYCGFNLHFPDD